MQKSQDGKAQLVRDFSKPGDDGGALPDGFIPWRRTLSYTVHPEMLSPVKCGQEHCFVVSVLHKIVSAEDAGYADLYDHAITIARARTARLKCSDIDAVLHTRIITHGWFTHANSNLARAFVTMGGVYLKHDEEPSQGQPLPSREELVVAGGMTPDNYALPPEQLKKRVYETYSVAYARDSVVPDTNVFTVSYGEYVPSCNEIDYKPLLERAEELARFHFSTQAVHSETNDRLQVVRREWFCATHPDIAVVHLYIQT
jgi:hypothetical protein